MNEKETEILGAWLDVLIAQHRAGQVVDIDHQCAQHPHLASYLRELFATQCAIESMKADRPFPHEPTSVQEYPVLGGYKVVRELARGGMGIVYEAVQLSLSRRVALKVISSHLQSKEDSVERFRREARVASQLHHSNIVPVFDVGQEGSVRYYAMQYIRGQSLDRLMVQMRQTRQDILNVSQSQDTSRGLRRVQQDNSRVESAHFERVARVGVQIAEALSAAHLAGILHRDVKPANILIDEHGTAWLTDFGLATLVEDSSSSGSLTESGDVLGTLRYMAPERLTGQQDQRCDIYSLAATLYEMLTLRAVVSPGDRMHVLQQISQHPPIPPRHLITNVPRDLETILLKGLSKEPELRYQNAGQLADDLRLFLLDRPILARRISWFEAGRRWFYRNPVLAGLGIALAFLFVVTLIGWQANRSLQSQRDQISLMYQRAQLAENEARSRALLSEVASYRTTLEPDLAARRRQLESFARSNLSTQVRAELRNEIAACWMRADWFNDDSSIAIEAVRVALDRHRMRMATIDAEGLVRICDYPSQDNSVVVQSLNFVPQALRFSRDGRFVIVSANSWFQIYHSRDGKPVYSGTQVVSDCDVSGLSHRAAFSHGNNRITVEAIDTQPTRKIMEHHAEHEIESAKISPLGDRLAYLTEETLVIVSVPGATIEKLANVKHSGLLEWSPDGKWLAITDQRHGIEIWDAQRGELTVSHPTLGSVIAYLDWDASSQLLACQTWDGCFQVQHAWTGKLLARTKRNVGQAEFGHDGRSLGWKFDEGRIGLVNWFPGLRTDLPGIARARQEMPLAMSFHPTKPLLAIATTQRVLLIDIRGGTCLGELPASQFVALGFTANGLLNVLSTRQTESWPIEWSVNDLDCRIGKVTVATTPQLTSGFFVADGQRAIATTVDNNLVEIDIGQASTPRTFGPSHGLSVKQLGRGELFALYDWHYPTIEIRRSDHGTAIGNLNVGENALAFADPNCNQLVTTNSKHIECWAVADLHKPTRSILPTIVIGAQVAYTSDGKVMAVQAVPYELQLIHATSGGCLMKLSFDFDDSITQLSFDPSDRYLFALCSRSGVVRKWDLAALQAALNEAGL